jgi:DNA-binding beta-propeller fold protein YncE
MRAIATVMFGATAVVYLLSGHSFADSTATPTAMGTPTAQAKVACQRALLDSGAAFIASSLGALESCISKAFKCAQNESAARDKCIANAAKCQQTIERVAFAQGDFAHRIVSKCGGSNRRPFPFATLLDTHGLAFQDVASECIHFGLNLVDLDTVVRCVTGRYTQEAERIFSLEQARARELFDLVGGSVPCDLAVVSGCQGCPFAVCLGGANDGQACSADSECLQGACRVPPTGSARLLSSLNASLPVRQCTGAANQAGKKLVGIFLHSVGACVNAIFRCVALNPDAPDACFAATATTKCAKAFASIDAAHTTLATAIDRKCGSQKIPYDTLRQPYAANIDALFRECADFGVTLNTLDDYAACIVKQHECRAAEALSIAAPRTSALLALLGHSLPLCTPSKEVRSQHFVSSAIGTTPAIGDIIRFIARPFGASNGSPSSGGGPQPGGFKTIDVEQRQFFQPKGSTRFSIHYVVGDPGSTLLVRVRNGDGKLIDGFFELPIADPSHDDAIVIAFRDEIRSCHLRLEFSSGDANGANAPEVQDQARVLTPSVPRTGGLDFVEMQRNGIAGVQNIECARSVAVSPDSNFVYLSSLGKDSTNCPDQPSGSGNAIAVFARRESGNLEFVQSVQECDPAAPSNGCDPAIHGITHPREAAVSPDGRQLYVAGGENGEPAIAWFARAADGRLTFSDRTPLDRSVLNMPYSLDFSPAGEYLYTAGGDSKTVVAYSRDATTGQLTVKDVKKEGDAVGNGTVISGLDGAHSVRVSPDGAHVYVAATVENAIAVFSRNATTGQLEFVQAIGLANVPTLHAPLSLAVSRDGNNVYCVGNDRDAINVFTRNKDTGALTFLEVHQDPNKTPGDVTAGRPTFVAVGPHDDQQHVDDQHVYVAGGAAEADDVVSVFLRDPMTGKLTLVKGGGGVSTITGIRSLAITPDDKSLFVTGNLEDAMAVFRVVPAE